MLFLTTLAPETLGLLRRIQAQSAFRDTRLVGGAALALHFGHRTSLDLDLFGMWDPQPPLEFALSKCASHVTKTGGEQNLQFFSVDGVKVDCVSYPYPWLEPAVEAEGIRVASIPDIAAMKLSAVTNRGTRKDFVDVYFLLKRYSLEQLLQWYQKKYNEGNTYLVLRSIVYFDDAEQEPMPNILQPVEWETVCHCIESAVLDYTRRVSAIFNQAGIPKPRR